MKKTITNLIAACHLINVIRLSLILCCVITSRSYGDSYKEFKLPDIGDDFSYTSLNNKEDLIGHFTQEEGTDSYFSCPFFLEKSSNKVFKLCDYGMTTAVALNNFGVVIGNCEVDEETTEACMWSKEKGLTRLGMLRSNDSGSEVIAINDGGDIVGNSYHDSVDGITERTTAFLYRNGVMQRAFPGAGRASEAYSINTKGHIVGAIARLNNRDDDGEYDPLTTYDLKPVFYRGRGSVRPLSSHLDTYQKLDINDHDDITDGLDLFNIRTRKSSYLANNFAKSTGYYPNGFGGEINNRGEIIGIVGQSGSDGYRISYIFDEKRNDRDLDCYAPVSKAYAAQGLNDRGTILAYVNGPRTAGYSLLRHSKKDLPSSCIELTARVVGQCNIAFNNFETGPEQVQPIADGTDCSIKTTASDRITHRPLQIQQIFQTFLYTDPEYNRTARSSITKTSDQAGVTQFTFSMDSTMTYSIVASGDPKKYRDTTANIISYQGHLDNNL